MKRVTRDSPTKKPSRRQTTVWLVHGIGDCSVCGKHWESRNSQALAAKHAKATGHRVHGEIGLAFEYGG